MIEKLLNILPDFMKQKLGMRIIYTVGSFATARLVAFLTGNYVNHALSVAVAAMAKIGINAVIQITSINEKLLEASITGFLMIVGEYFIEQFHDKKVLPVVAPEAQQAASAAIPPKAA